MAVKIKFDSDTNYALFDDQVDMRHPSNMITKNADDLEMEFEGEPSFQLQQLGRQLGGVWED